MSEEGARAGHEVASDGGARDGDGAPADEAPDDRAPAGRGTASYVFRVRFRVEPDSPEVSVEPSTFETVLSQAADPPGEAGWLFFRDNLWRGELNDEVHFRELTGEALGVTVDSVTFSELRTDGAHWEAFRGAIADDLESFAADTVDEAVSKYLGSSVRVVEDA